MFSCQTEYLRNQQSDNFHDFKKKGSISMIGCVMLFVDSVTDPGFFLIDMFLVIDIKNSYENVMIKNTAETTIVYKIIFK